MGDWHHVSHALSKWPKSLPQYHSWFRDTKVGGLQNQPKKRFWFSHRHPERRLKREPRKRSEWTHPPFRSRVSVSFNWISANLFISWLVISHSRKSNPLDNAVIESFHALLKKETLYNHHITSLKAYIQHVHEWMHYYNTFRPRLKKK